MLGVKRTLTAEEVSVTTPPPTVLYTTAPDPVEIGVADSGLVGATSTEVGDGRVVAVISEDSAEEMAELTDAATELDCSAELDSSGVVAEEVVVVTVLFDPCLLAICTSLLAITGFSECTCSIAVRSLLKMPSLNLGDNACNTR